MINNKIKFPTLISMLWVFILLNTIIRDLHEFLRQGYIEEMMALNISEETMLFYGIIVEIPILMVVLSRILGNNANKWANIVAASVTILGVFSTLPTGDMDDVFFGIIESAALLLIMIIAWQLPKLSVPEI